MKQPSFFDSALPLVVFRVRDDERIEVRWPDSDLCATFRDWKVALDMMQHYGVNPASPFNEASVRVRR